MTHDPLCPYEPDRRTPCTHGLDENGFATIESITTDMCQGERHYWPGTPCECDLIEEVRADQATATLAALRRLGDDPEQDWMSDEQRAWVMGYRAGFSSAVDAVRGLDGKS